MKNQNDDKKYELTGEYEIMNEEALSDGSENELGLSKAELADSRIDLYCDDCYKSFDKSLCVVFKEERRKKVFNIGKDVWHIILSIGDEISFFGQILNFGKSVKDEIKDISELIRVWKFATFFVKFYSGSVTDKDIEKFRKKIENGEWTSEDTYCILSCIETTKDAKKEEWYALVVKEYIFGHISREYYYDYLSIIDKIFLSDVMMVEANWETLSVSGYIVAGNSRHRNLYRLASYGIGEHGTPYDEKERLELDKSGQERYYYADNYSRTFFNIITEKEPKLPLDVKIEYRNDRAGSPIFFMPIDEP